MRVLDERARRNALDTYLRLVVERDFPEAGREVRRPAVLRALMRAYAAGATFSHLRTHRGEHEVDLIVERDDGRVLAIEIKLGATPTDRDVRHVHRLAERIGPDIVDSIVVTTGPAAYRRPDGVGVVPLALLVP